MNIQEVDEKAVQRVKSLLTKAMMPDLFNHYISMSSWLENRPLHIIQGSEWAILVSLGETTELMRPLGNLDKEEMAQIIQQVREQHPDKILWIYGLDDKNVEFFDKKQIDDIQPSYVLNAHNIADLASKKMRNAVAKMDKTPCEIKPLNMQTLADAQSIVADWAKAESNASTSFHENLLREHLDDPTGFGFVLYHEERPVGWSYACQDQAFPQYAIMSINLSVKNVNGVSEYLMWKTAQQAIKRWDVKYVNYGGGDPKGDPGLHTYKKKFGWDHCLIEYGIKYDPLNPE